MPKRVMSHASAVAASLCMVIAFSTNGALATGDCLVQTSRQTGPPTGHWYYRVDRVNHRKCWYLRDLRTRVPQAEPSEARPFGDAALQATFSSFLSLLPANFTGTKPIGTGQSATNSNARAMQTHLDDLTNDDVLWVKPARIARHPDSNAALTPKTNRQVAGPRAEHTNQPPSLDQEKRDALFQEFLQWQAGQTR